MNKKMAENILPILFLPLILVYYETLLRIFNSDFIFPEYIYSCLFALSAGLLAAAVFSLLPHKLNKICTTATLAAAGTSFAAECLIKKNFQAYMTPASVFSAAGNVVSRYTGILAASILDGLAEMILFYAPVIIYAIFGSRLLLAPKQKIKPVFSLIPAVCSVMIFGSGAAAVSFGECAEQYSASVDFDISVETFGLLTACRLNIMSSILPGEPETGFAAVNYSPEISGTAVSESKPTSPEKVTKPEITLGHTNGNTDKLPYDIAKTEITLGYTGKTEDTFSDSADITETVAETEVTDEHTAIPDPELGDNIMELDFDAAYNRSPNSITKELNNYVQTLTPTNKNKYTGIFKGKNLILICAEAFSDSVINEELTPTLYRLSHNGFYFSDYYQPTWGGSTTTGEYSFVSGLVPESGLESMQKIGDNNNYFTLGNQLQRQNYASCAFHNGNYDYYSRNITHPNLGYDSFLAFGNGLENITRKYSEDSVMFDKTLDLYIDRQPFSLYYMTVSGHLSYNAGNIKVTENMDRVNEVFGNKYKDKTKYYICYQMELEKALTVIVEKLEAAGIADDTVICLTADHYPYGLEQGQTYGNPEDYVTDLYGYKHSTPWEKDHNAWILWSGCLDNEYKDYACEVSAPTYSLDIVPTLSNLFGLEYDSRLLVGRDVFSNAEPLVIWNNYSWVTDKGSYNSRTKKFTPAEGFGTDSDYIAGINRIVKNKIYFSHKTADCDYYGALFGADEIT